MTIEEEFKDYCVALEFSPKSPRFSEFRRFAINCLYVRYWMPKKVADEMDYYEVLSNVLKRLNIPRSSPPTQALTFMQMPKMSMSVS